MKIYNYQYTGEDKPRPTRSKKQRWLGFLKSRKFWTWVFRAAAFGVFGLSLLFLSYTRSLPDPNKLLSRAVPESTKIFARDGSLLYEIHGEAKRTLVNLDQISPNLQHATIAVEDKDFYHNPGVSVRGIFRSLLVDITSGRKAQGASTITQQFVKNAILTKEKSWDRKIKEAILALAIDARFSKDQILQMYLNEIPYGRNAYGAEAAAQTYFGKSANNLDLAEAAYLAALPQAPTFYNPTGTHRQDLEDRKNTILTLMQQQGYISKEDEQKAKNEKVAFQEVKNSITAPHFVMMVEDYLAAKYGESTLEGGGLKVYTTLDPRLQKIAENAVSTGVTKFSKKYNANNAALVAVDPKTGQILAMVGSKNYFGDPEPAGCTPGKNCVFEPNVNVALSQRQPGSSFKPYVYLTAFSKDFKYTPASELLDVVTNFGTYNGKPYIPRNYNEHEYGPVSMRQALAGSLNVPAVKTLDLVGVNNAVQTARNLGITSPLSDCGLSLVLGGCEVRLLDHVAAFSVIANEGVKHDKTPILKIIDKDGQTLEEYQDNPGQQVVDPQAAYELISIMTDNNARSFVFGANSPLILSDRTVAAKTGTTQNWHDGWTMGFTPSLTAGVWAGNNDGTLLTKGADGVVVAAPIWHQFMQEALAGTPAEDFQIPDGIKRVEVDSVSGKLPTQFTQETKMETFADYSVPTQYDDVHVNVAIDSTTGQPATSMTTPDRTTYQVYTVFHSEKPDNPNWENPVVAWALAHGYSYPPGGSIFIPQQQNGNQPTVDIIEPSDGTSVFRLPFPIVVSVSSPNPIAHVDLSIDGQFVQSLTSAPFVFNINRSLSDGGHMFAVKAVDNTGASSDTSVNVNYSLSSPLLMSEPTPQAVLQFPATLSAESGQNFGIVNFYAQSDKGNIQLIGTSNNISNIGNKIKYSLTWDNKPTAGTYRIYAQTQNGITSPKIKVTVAK